MVDANSSYDDLINAVIDGLNEVQAKTGEDLTDWLDKYPPIAPHIPVAQGALFVTEEGYRAARLIGNKWYQQDPSKRPNLSRDAAERAAVHAFGQVINSAGDYPSTSDVKSLIIEALEKRIQESAHPETFYFAARVFEQSDVVSFDIGPVKFLRRADLPSHIEAVSGRPLKGKAALLRYWSGNPRSKPRSRDGRDIVDAVGPADWVIAVRVSGRTNDRAAECARVAATVGLDSLGLSLGYQTGRQLRGPDDVTRGMGATAISQYDGRGLNRRTSFNLPHVGGRPGTQAQLLKGTSKLQDAVASALISFVSDDAAKRMSLKQRWVEAMYWFGQSRREMSDFIALVKVGIALDVLAKGSKAKGITKLTAIQFQLAEDDPILSDGRSVKKVIGLIYDEGRSQIAHGGKLALLNEMPVERAVADDLARQVLIGYVACLEKYTGPDQYDAFLKAMPAIRAAL